MPEHFDLLLSSLKQLLDIGHGSVDRLSFWLYLSLIYKAVIIVLNKFL